MVEKEEERKLSNLLLTHDGDWWWLFMSLHPASDHTTLEVLPLPSIRSGMSAVCGLNSFLTEWILAQDRKTFRAEKILLFIWIFSRFRILRPRSIASKTGQSAPKPSSAESQTVVKGRNWGPKKPVTTLFLLESIKWGWKILLSVFPAVGEYSSCWRLTSWGLMFAYAHATFLSWEP